jgi:hypothetical protein
MQVETFRYLMSALAQVYGALVFGVAVFLVVRHQQLRTGAEQAKDALARLLVREKTPGFLPQRDPGGYAAWFDTQTAAFRCLPDTQAAAEVEKVLGELSGLIAKTNRTLQNPRPSNRREVEGRLGLYRGKSARIEQVHARYGRQQEDLRSFARDAVMVLGVPAFLCWLFSFGFLFADRLGGHLQTENFAGWAVVLAGAGLWYLVQAAVGMLGDSTDGEFGGAGVSPDE